MVNKQVIPSVESRTKIISKKPLISNTLSQLWQFELVLTLFGWSPQSCPTALLYLEVLYMANAFNALEKKKKKNGRLRVFVWNCYYIRRVGNLKFKGVRLSSAEPEFQPWLTNVNHVNCYIPRLYALSLCKYSWYRNKNAKLIRALPSLTSMSTFSPHVPFLVM